MYRVQVRVTKEKNPKSNIPCIRVRGLGFRIEDLGFRL